MFCACEHCETARIRGGRHIRTRSQAAVFAQEVDQGSPDERLLIDFPPDTYLHRLQHGLRLEQIGHMLVTHSHKDHFAPADLAFRYSIYANPTPPFPLHIYGNDKVKQKLLSTLIKPHELEELVFHEVENGRPFMAGAFKVTPLPALHDRTERCLIYLIEHAGRTLLYGNDTGIFPQETWDILAGRTLDLVSLDCTSCKLKEGTNHMGLPDNIEVVNRLRAADCLTPDSKIILHHFSHNGGVCYDEMVKMVKPYGFDVSYDGGVWVV